MNRAPLRICRPRCARTRRTRFSCSRTARISFHLVSRGGGSSLAPDDARLARALRRGDRARRSGGPGRRGVRGLRRVTNDRGRARGARRTGRFVIADRELSRRVSAPNCSSRDPLRVFAPARAARRTPSCSTAEIRYRERRHSRDRRRLAYARCARRRRTRRTRCVLRSRADGSVGDARM